jgi:hypothetical protein
VSQFEKILHKPQTPTKTIAIRRNKRNHRRVILGFLGELAENGFWSDLHPSLISSPDQGRGSKRRASSCT